MFGLIISEHTKCEDTDGGGNVFDCSGEETNKVLKAVTLCTGAGCDNTTCCGMYFIYLCFFVYGALGWE